MPLTLDTIRSLDANKSYYISNATGQIKEAGFWHKFKMYFSVGDAEKKTEKLLHEVKIALLAASGETDNAALTADIDNFSDNHNWCFPVSGRSRRVEVAEDLRREALEQEGEIPTVTEYQLSQTIA